MVTWDAAVHDPSGATVSYWLVAALVLGRLVNELNASIMFGFLIWSAFCLGMLAAERYTSRKWKRAAKAMEQHAAHLQAMIDCTPPERMEPVWARSIPEGVETYAKEQQ